MVEGPPLVVQWIRLQRTAGRSGSVPTQGTRPAAEARREREGGRESDETSSISIKFFCKV